MDVNISLSVRKVLSSLPAMNSMFPNFSFVGMDGMSGPVGEAVIPSSSASDVLLPSSTMPGASPSAVVIATALSLLPVSKPP